MKIKRCPFCGSKAVNCKPDDRDRQYRVQCAACSAEGPHKEEVQEAVNAWNTAK